MKFKKRIKTAFIILFLLFISVLAIAAAREKAARTLYDDAIKGMQEMIAAQSWDRIDLILEKYFAANAVINDYLVEGDMPVNALMFDSSSVMRDQFAGKFHKQMDMYESYRNTPTLKSIHAGLIGSGYVDYTERYSGILRHGSRRLDISGEGDCRLMIAFYPRPLIAEKTCKYKAQAAEIP